MGGNDRRHRDDHGTAHAEGDAAGAHAEALPAFAYDFTIGGSDPAQLARTLAALPASQRGAILERATARRGNAFTVAVVEALDVLAPATSKPHNATDSAPETAATVRHGDQFTDGTAKQIADEIAKQPEANRATLIARVQDLRGHRFTIDVEASLLHHGGGDPLAPVRPDEFNYGTAQSWIMFPSLDASREVFEMLDHVSDEEVGVILRAFEKDGLLENFLKPLPFAYPKALAARLPQGHGHVLSILRPYYENKGGDDNSVTGMLNRIPGVGGALAFGFDGLTFGFAREHDAAYKAKQQGTITEDEYVDHSNHAGTRAAVVGATALATGGTSAAYAEGLTLDLAAAGTGGRMISTTAIGGAGGAGAGFGAQLGSDVVDGELSSPTQYGKSIAIGTGFGLAGGAVGGAVGETIRSLPEGMQAKIAAFAKRFPADADIFEHYSDLGRQHAGTIRLTAARLKNLVETGAATFADPGLVTVAAGMAPDASITITAELIDAADGAPLHITRAERLADDFADDLGGRDVVDLMESNEPRRASFADEADDIASDADLIESIDVDDLPSRHGDLLDEHQDGITVRSHSDAQQSGIVPDEGAVYNDQHHVFPDEHREWFGDSENVQQFFDVDDFTLDIEHELHGTMHAGRGQWEGEWNTRILAVLKEARKNSPRALTVDEMKTIARRELDRFDVPSDAPYGRYTGTKDTAARRKAKRAP